MQKQMMGEISGILWTGSHSEDKLQPLMWQLMGNWNVKQQNRTTLVGSKTSVLHNPKIFIFSFI